MSSNNSYYTVKQIYPWLYSVKDPLNVFCYVIVGAESAILYDTAYGVGDLPQTVREITDKPYLVIVGHGHVDHACGSYQFSEVLLRKEDFELCKLHNSEQFRRSVIAELHQKNLTPEGFAEEEFLMKGTGNLKELSADAQFTLGGLTVQVVPLPGHTHGSVGLWIREKRVMLAGDSIGRHIWMFLEESTSMAVYIETLRTVSKLDLMEFLGGHYDVPVPKADIERYIRVAQEANMEKAEAFDMPEFAYLKPFHYYQGEGLEYVGIVFSEEKL